ncbi:hypothetical protein MVES1_003631 [Malassezia vespertilionis]|nr:uncharacterized protein MVES1_003631 [Malassezia vespertilionis]WFD08259.1 hypothetical protein MVES1_003631 [Malassezia vespertilionis]
MPGRRAGSMLRRTEETLHKALQEGERLDLRASQRTFDGAYLRGALGQLTFSMMIMKIFEPAFFWIGLANCVLALGLFATAFFRYRMTMHYEPNSTALGTLQSEARTEPVHMIDPDSYVYLPRFKTAGSVVVCVSAFVIMMEIAIIVLIATML